MTRVKVCVVDGSQVKEELHNLEDVQEGEWYACPVPTLLGVPLMVRSMGPSVDQNNQISVYMMIDPETGFAPPEWLALPDMHRKLMFKRGDHLSRRPRQRLRSF